MSFRSKAHDFVDWLYEYSQVISTVLLVILAVIDISNLNDVLIDISRFKQLPIGNVFYYIIVVLSLCFGVIAIGKTQLVKKLENDISAKGSKIVDLENNISEVMASRTELFNSYLRLISENLSFTHAERISVYKVHNNEFVLIARSSKNPLFEKPGRKSYPISEGFIGKAWAEGEYFNCALPECSGRNRTPYHTYVNNISSIPREVVNRLNMASRSYCIVRVNGFDSQPTAVIAIESINPNAFQRDAVINIIESVKAPLVMFIEKNNIVDLDVPNPSGL